MREENLNPFKSYSFVAYYDSFVSVLFISLNLCDEDLKITGEKNGFLGGDTFFCLSR